MTLAPLERGLPDSEYRTRLARAQAALDAAGLAGLLLTTDADIRWATGFLTRFWESPSRPWFMVLPTHGLPIAVIPEIGVPLMRQTWVRDIRSWPAPHPTDDGISLLIDALQACGGPIGVPDGREAVVRLPWADFDLLRSAVPITSDQGIMARLRAIKSEAEVARIRSAAQVAGRAFDRVPEIAAPGTPLDQVFREFQRLCLAEGADWVPYLAGGAGPDGYADVISPATPAPLAVGDILMLDTGVIRDGYFCDFDRNFAVGAPSPLAQEAQARLMAATHAGFEAACPGATAADLFTAMDGVLGDRNGGGRLGHGLGLQLTEGMSLTPWDLTVLEPGMVLTLEPGITTGEGRIMVHEENIIITQDGADWISPLAPTVLPVLG